MQTAHVNFAMNILVMVLRTLLMLILYCILVPSVKSSVRDPISYYVVLSNFEIFDNFIPIFFYYRTILF